MDASRSYWDVGPTSRILDGCRNIHSSWTVIVLDWYGVDVVYLLVQGAEVTMFESFLQAAKATGVKHVVYGRGPFDRVHTELPAGGSRIATTILHPTSFRENAVFNCTEPIRRTGQFYSSAGGFGGGVERPRGARCEVNTLTTEALTEEQLAETISKVAGKTVTHVDLNPDPRRV